MSNWDAASGFRWWQENGYHRWRTSRVLAGHWFIRCSADLPDLPTGFTRHSGVTACVAEHGFGVSTAWNYDLMTAGYLLALVPTLIILAGVAVSAWRFIRQPSAEWFVLLGFSGTLLLALIFMNLTVPHISRGESILRIMRACAALFLRRGWLGGSDAGRKRLQFALGTILLVWAMNSFASVWIRSNSAPTHVYLGLMLGR